MTTTRHDYYQTDTHLIVSIYKKAIPADQVRIAAQSNELEVFVADDTLLRLAPLSGSIVPDGISHTVYGTKIEVKLPKATAEHWASLVGSSDGPTLTQLPSEVNHSTGDGTDSKKPPPGKKNWDSLAKEIDNAEEEPHGNPDEFFKSLYSDLDPDSRRAMLKSYQESNGTVLSTNWGEVGQKYQTPKPPDGVEIRKG